MTKQINLPSLLFSRNEARILGDEKHSLLRKLMDVELEGKEASRELNKLRETCQKLRHVCVCLVNLCVNF